MSGSPRDGVHFSNFPNFSSVGRSNIKFPNRKAGIGDVGEFGGADGFHADFTNGARRDVASDRSVSVSVSGKFHDFSGSKYAAILRDVFDETVKSKVASAVVSDQQILTRARG